MASLLRRCPCEEVRAATELVAYSLHDEQLLDLVTTDPVIAKACQNHLWEAELADLLQSQLENSPRQTHSLTDFLTELLPTAQMLDGRNSSAIQGALSGGMQLFLASQSAETNCAINRWFPLQVFGTPLQE